MYTELRKEITFVHKDITYAVGLFTKRIVFGLEDRQAGIALLDETQVCVVADILGPSYTELTHMIADMKAMTPTQIIDVFRKHKRMRYDPDPSGVKVIATQESFVDDDRIEFTIDPYKLARTALVVRTENENGLVRDYTLTITQNGAASLHLRNSWRRS